MTRCSHSSQDRKGDRAEHFRSLRLKIDSRCDLPYDPPMDSACDRRSFLRSLALLGFASPLLASCPLAPGRSRVRRIGFIVGAGYDPLVEHSRMSYALSATSTEQTLLSKRV
jgi:hypothetical protein